jgi:hypothetical protein
MKKLLLAALATIATTVGAQMPVPLLDNAPPEKVIDLAVWRAAAPALQAALECKTKITPKIAALRPLLVTNERDQWEMIPPEPFSVLGLPVDAVVIYMDRDEQMGHSYTSIIMSKSLAEVRAAAKIKPKNDGRNTKIGNLGVGQPHGPDSVELTCTIAGKWQD